MLSLSETSDLLIWGRVVVGFSTGLLSGTLPSYVVEIAIISNRGLLGACFQVDQSLYSIHRMNLQSHRLIIALHYDWHS